MSEECDSAGVNVRGPVVLTGAGGRIGRAITPLLPRTWEVIATDRVPADGISSLDVNDREACAETFAGADAVVHLAAVPDPEAAWDVLLSANIMGTQSVAQAAMVAGVRRLVLASSLQAVSALPAETQVRTSDPPRPANLYGATKAWAEALGSWVASASGTTVVALRIGNFQLQRPDQSAVSARDLAAWLSPGDAADLIRAAVEADIGGFVVANGVSANRYRNADLESTMSTIGYRPLSDAWHS